MNAAPSLEFIVDAACWRYRLTLTQLKAKRRNKNAIRAKEAIVYLAKFYTTESLPDIARAVGYAEHSAAVTANKRAIDLVNRSADFRDILFDIHERAEAQMKLHEEMETPPLANEEAIDVGSAKEELCASVNQSIANKVDELLASSWVKINSEREALQSDIDRFEAAKQVIREYQWNDPNSLFCQAVAAVATAITNLQDAEHSPNQAQAQKALNRASEDLRREFFKVQHILEKELS